MATTLTWNPEMGDASLDPALEQETRTAIIAAWTFMVDHPDAKPVFDGGPVLAPINDDARQLEAICMQNMPADLTGVQRATILSTAVYASRLAATHDWEYLGAELTRSRKSFSGRRAR